MWGKKENFVKKKTKNTTGKDHTTLEVSMQLQLYVFLICLRVLNHTERHYKRNKVNCEV